MVKLSNQNGSIRTLNSKHLVVDWLGNHNLFYRMTREQFKEGLKNGVVLVEQMLNKDFPEIVSFSLTLKPTGAMAIGCEKFTRDDVRKIKRWAKEGRRGWMIFNPLPIFLRGHWWKGNQYLVMSGDNFQPVLVSLVKNRVYGTDKLDGAGKGAFFPDRVGGGLKHFLYLLLWSLLTLGGCAGWGLAVKELMAPREKSVQVVVTEESFLKAQDLCNRYMRTSSGVIGQVGLETAIYEHVVLPCRIVLKGGETK